MGRFKYESDGPEGSAAGRVKQKAEKHTASSQSSGRSCTSQRKTKTRNDTHGRVEKKNKRQTNSKSGKFVRPPLTDGTKKQANPLVEQRRS